VDLLLFGKQAIDGDTAQVGPGVATRLDVPLITYAVRIESIDPVGPHGDRPPPRRAGHRGPGDRLPALLTVEKEIAAIAARPCPTWSAPRAISPRSGTPSPVPFDPARIGIKGIGHHRGKAFTPPPKEPGELVSVAEARPGRGRRPGAGAHRRGRAC
jgi:electron transfer flavoprotein beta subunit